MVVYVDLLIDTSRQLDQHVSSNDTLHQDPTCKCPSSYLVLYYNLNQNYERFPETIGVNNFGYGDNFGFRDSSHLYLGPR